MLRFAFIVSDTSYEFTPCPICGAVAATQVAGADDIRAEVELLWAFQGQRLDGETLGCARIVGDTPAPPTHFP